MQAGSHPAALELGRHEDAMVDISAYPAWCRFWCHPPPCFVPPGSLHCGLHSLASPSLACLPALLLLLLCLVRWLSSLASPPQPRSPMGPLYRKQGAPERWEVGGEGPNSEHRGLIGSQARTSEGLGLWHSDPPVVTVIGYSRNCSE